MSHVLSSETGMPVAPLMKIVDTADGMMVQVRWKGLSQNEDTLEPPARIFKDVPRMLHRLLARKNTPKQLADSARNLLRI